ncbi:metallophosphoesterase [Enterococcus sp. DIV0174]|uniref:metallophosphoesterase n=1 Tax=Enterococcus sp. DIV0174 TaxID=2774785 RepID=UPI003D2FBCD4
MGFVTDSHYDFGTWRKNAYLSLRNLNNILSLSDKMQVLICGGDNVDSEQISYEQKISNMQSYLSFFYSGKSADRFAIRGNHDQGGLISYNQNGKVFPIDIISDDLFKKQMKSEENLYGEVRDDNSLYGYKDYHQQKIRVVFVDSLDNPEILNNDGSLKYLAQWDYGYQEKQLKWIASVALGKCPDNYHVIMFSHIPLRIRQEELRNHRNFDLLINLINSFINRRTVTLQSNIKDFEVQEFTTDFSIREESNFVGFISGHDHTESIIQNEYFKTIVCDNAWPEDDSYLNSYKEDSFTILQIDIVNRKLILNGFGRSTIRSIDY